MTTGVYAIINTITGQVYVGSSVNIEARWSSHRSRFSGSDYEWTILEATGASDEELERTEQRWMDHYEGRLYNARKVAKRYPTPRHDYRWVQRKGRWVRIRMERRASPPAARSAGEET